MRYITAFLFINNKYIIYLLLISYLVILPGIFIASFASIPTLWVNIKKAEIVPSTNNILVLIGFTIWYFFDLIYPILLSILFIKLLGQLGI